MILPFLFALLSPESLDDIEAFMEEEKLPMMEVKTGTKIKMLLLGSRDSKMERMSRGIHTDTFEGVARNDLKVGTRFELDVGFDVITTSFVEYIGNGIIHTRNSTYSIEIIKPKEGQNVEAQQVQK